MELSRKALNISASITLDIDAKAKKMKAEGLDIVGFGAGEPDFDTPSFIIEAAKEALDKGITRYTPAAGTIELKKAICNKFLFDNKIEYEPNQIIISNGAKHSLYNVFQAILNPGDEVIIPTPYWNTYPEAVKMADGIPVYVKTNEENDFKVTPDDLDAAITPKTKAFILNSPSNPCGCIYDINELKILSDYAIKNNFFIISDEIYESLVYDNNKHISIASLGDNIKDLTIIINGMSKAYAMTGWRIGYAAGRKDIIDVMSNIQSHSTSNPNSIAQYASVVALLSSPKDIINDMIHIFSTRRNYMYNQINNTPLLSCRLPKGAFYIMMNISKTKGKVYNGSVIDGSMSFANLLLESEKVTVVPGIAFGADDYVRLSYATSTDNIEIGLNRIKSFVNKLK